MEKMHPERTSRIFWIMYMMCVINKWQTFSLFIEKLTKYKVFDIRIQFVTWLLHSMFVQKDYKLSYDFLFLAFVVVLDHHNSFEVFIFLHMYWHFLICCLMGKLSLHRKSRAIYSILFFEAYDLISYFAEMMRECLYVAGLIW